MPGTNIKEHLQNYDDIMNRYNETGLLDIPPIPKESSIPINRIDQAAMQHDYISKDLQDRHVADIKMIHQINNIPNPTFREKLERFIVKSIMKGNILIGQGLERHAKNVANKKILEVENEDEVRSQSDFNHK